MKIHVVEDETALLRAITMALTKAGHAVSSSTDGGAAFGEIKKAKPEVVIMDLLLPGKNGMEVIKEIRADGFAGVIIVFTNFDPKDIDRDDIVKLKISDVLVKSSISLSQLIDAINKATS
jgi:DNA-binding response OmpR family regulator